MFCGSVLKASAESPAPPVVGFVPSARIQEAQFVGVSSTASAPRRRSSSRTYSNRRRRAAMYSSAVIFRANFTTPLNTAENLSRFASQNSHPK